MTRPDPKTPDPESIRLTEKQRVDCYRLSRNAEWQSFLDVMNDLASKPKIKLSDPNANAMIALAARQKLISQILEVIAWSDPNNQRNA